MTRLRKLMLDELQRRNYAKSTVRSYIHAIQDFAKYFGRSPERLGPEHIRQYQVHLFQDCKLSLGTIQSRTSALRFLFVKTLRRPYLPDDIPVPKRQRRMPIVLSQEEVERLIASARNLMHRTMLMMLYATGLRRAELCHLKVYGRAARRWSGASLPKAGRSKSQLLPVGVAMRVIDCGIFSSMGPYLSEMFPTPIRGTGQRFCFGFGHSIGAFFPAFIGIYSAKWRLGVAIPLFFGIATALMLAALILLPETKGRNPATGFGEETAEKAQAATH